VNISAVVVTRNEGAELRRTVENLQETLPPRSELIVVNDGSRGRIAHIPGTRMIEARSVGVARARNLGASHARGDILVFADAHIRLDPEWWKPLTAILENPHAGAAAPAVLHLHGGTPPGYGLRFTGPDLDVRWLTATHGQKPFKAAILPGCCLAIRRDTFDAVGGWDGGLLHRGGVDNEMAVRLWTLGYDLYVAPAVSCRHLFRERSPFPVGWPQYLHNRLRLAMAHFSAPRLAKVVAALHSHDAFGEAMALALENGVTERRRDMRDRRLRTDNQYFARFESGW
jgi:GT2 family glycosyltransferase